MTEELFSRSELIREMVDVGSTLTSDAPLVERLNMLCASTARMLRSDRVNIVVRDRDTYRRQFGYGHDPALATMLRNFRVDRSLPIVQEIEACETYLMFPDAPGHLSMGDLARQAAVASNLIVPFTYPDGSPFGFMTVEWTSPRSEIPAEEGELALGLARLAQATLLRNHESQLRRESSESLVTVEDQQRRRLSSELHDDPLQRLLGLRLGLESFLDRAGDDLERSTISRFVEQCREASASVREVMVRTHPTATEDVDLHSMLQSLVARMSVDNLSFELIDERTMTTPDHVEAALSRIAEQAVTHAVEQAHGTSLSVTIYDESLSTVMSIRSNGRRFSPTARSRNTGMVSVRERVDSLGGTFQSHSEPSFGTTVTVTIPHA